MPAARTILSRRWRISSNIRRGSPNRPPRAAVCRREAAVRGDEVGGRSRAAGTAARADQGASRSRQQDPARRGPHRGIQRRTEQRRARPAVGRRICGVRARQQRLPRKIRLSLYRLRPPPHQGFRSCAISNAGCRTTRRPKCKHRSRKSAGSPRCASINWWRPTTGLPVHGRLSTHVLDTHSGKPAAGISVELVELSELGASRVVTRAVTNSDGRTDQPLIGGRPVPIGRYELTFQRRRLFCRSRRAAVRSAVSRPHSVAVFGERPRRPSPRAAAGHAVELCDLSGELIALTSW